MIPMKNKKRLLFLFIILFNVGCATRIGDLTVLSTRNIDLSNTTLDMSTGKRVTAEDCRYSILGLIPLGIPNLKNAVDYALDKGNGNIMIDQVTNLKSNYFVLFGENCIEVKGTVLTTNKI